MFTGKDRRVQKTHQLLRDALVSLIHEKDYDAIVVKEILDRANVGRSAFYTHFHDKDSLLASSIHQMLDASASQPLPASAERFGRVLRFSLPVFEYVQPFRHAADTGMGSEGRAAIHEHLREALLVQVRADVRATIARPDGRGDAMPPIFWPNTWFRPLFWS